jgi:plastocyanin
MRLAVVLAAAAGLLLVQVGADAAGQRRKPRTHTIVMEATAFSPEKLTAAAGDTIVWVNKDPFPHTATSGAGKFDSGAIAAGKSWKYTVRRKGTFDYLCTFHPTMKAVLRVE